MDRAGKQGEEEFQVEVMAPFAFYAMFFSFIFLNLPYLIHPAVYFNSRVADYEFQVELLSRLRSPYLLTLVGFCSESNHKLLVYEFMANGGLQEHLYRIGGKLFYWFLSKAFYIV